MTASGWLKKLFKLEKIRYSAYKKLNVYRTFFTFDVYVLTYEIFPYDAEYSEGKQLFIVMKAVAGETVEYERYMVEDL